MKFDERYQATIETERQLLGGILIESSTLTRDAIIETVRIIQPEDFIDSHHSQIFAAMITCDSPAHYISVARELDRQGKLEKGDCSFLVQLTADCICTPLDILHYARLVKEYSDLRRGKRILRIKGAV